MKTIEIYPPNTPVSFVATNGEVAGHVTSIQIRSDLTVCYLVAWWSGRDRREEWVMSSEVTSVSKPQKTRIGFIE